MSKQKQNSTGLFYAKRGMPLGRPLQIFFMLHVLEVRVFVLKPEEACSADNLTVIHLGFPLNAMPKRPVDQMGAIFVPPLTGNTERKGGSNDASS